MFHALRAELAYFRPWILGGLGIALGVVIIMSVVFHFVGDDGPPRAIATGLCGFFPIIAGMVVGFIAQAYRTEERRARLLRSTRSRRSMVTALWMFPPPLPNR